MRRVWKPMICLFMAAVIGFTGWVSGALPVYGEESTVYEEEPVPESAQIAKTREVEGAPDGEEASTVPAPETSLESSFDPQPVSLTDDAVEPENPEANPETSPVETVPFMVETSETESPELITEEIPLYDAESSAAATTFTLDVSYPSDIKCKQETTFTLQASGGSGNYKYRIYSLMILDGSEWVNVYDISKGNNSAYTTDNTFKFTFHASGTYYIRFNAMDMSTGKYIDSGRPGYKLEIKDPSHPSVEEIAKQVVEECEKTCRTDYEKALWLHDWIIHNMEYDQELKYCSAEGALARGLGTCEAYHRGYVMLLKEAGIRTGRMTGNGHVWTAVEIGGEWYQVDTTWDDKTKDKEGVYDEHMYFGLSDYVMGLVHTDHKGVAGYESTSLEHNYFIQSGDIKTWSDPFAAIVRQKLQAGESEFEISVSNDNMPSASYGWNPHYKNVLCNLIAYQLTSKENWNGKTLSVSYKDGVFRVKEGQVTDGSFVLSIIPPSKVSYKKGESVDTAGLTVRAVYGNGQTRLLRSGEYQVSGFDTRVVGTRKATVSWNGESAVFTYTVSEPPTQPVSPTTPVTPTKPVAPTKPVTPSIPDAGIQYQTHVQSYGWQGWKQDGTMSGTEGQAKRLEAIRIELVKPPVSGSVEYRTHIQTYGWEADWKQNGERSGTEGESKRLEAIQIRLTDDMAKQYDIYYRVHAQSYGWLGWAKNGTSAGTAGYAKRLEGIEIRLVKKGGAAPGSCIGSFRQNGADAGVNYHTHVQTFGWQDWRSNGVMSGTEGQAKRLEAIEIKIENMGISGTVEYRTHIQTYGWEAGWKRNGQMSGTSGEAKRLEAIQIRLTDEMAKQYDIYYRVHAQSYGWLGWAKNGASAGTAGYAKRLEGIEIRLVKKGGAAPGPTSRAYIEK